MADEPYGPLPRPGGALVLRAQPEDPLPGFLETCARHGVHVARDVVLGMPGDETELTAQMGDFWYHTDAAFLPEPPRWILIQVIQAHEGGNLHVLDVGDLLPQLDVGDAMFGQGEVRLQLPVVDAVGGVQFLRYRRDYMSPVPGGADLECIHALVEAHAEAHARCLGALGPMDCAVFDNWQTLHRREAFGGRRVVRRLWLA
jgi:hypothetical protein